MISLSYLSRAIIFFAIASVASIATVWFAYTDASHNVLLSSAVILAVAVALGVWNLVLVKMFVNQATKVCAAVRIGDFDQRIIAPSAKGDLKVLADKLNAMVDINDAFVREAALALTAASEGRFYRNIRPEGMMGMFAHSVGKINEAIEIMGSAESIRLETMELLRRDFTSVIGAATKGDFTKRIASERSDDALNELAGQVNKLISTVNRGLGETGSVLSAIATMNLSSRVEGEYDGAFDNLKKDTNTVAEKLSEIVGQLRDTSGTLKMATGEILSGANDLSERTLKQAATIEETSATVEQLSSMVTENAERAATVSENTQAVSRAANEGGEVMNQATEAMERITTSSAKISNVIGMIDDIAFQTNLLALNASVEAARAGEAGKGFAVVAVEVRRLAQSAAEASAEVKELIETSASEVSEGSKLLSVASDKLVGMMESVQENTGIMQQVASASRDQASSIDEVSTAVRQMDEMTQHNAALVEETNAAIEQTDNQVAEMDGIVDVFRLEMTQDERREKAEMEALKNAPVSHNRRATDKAGQQSSRASTAGKPVESKQQTAKSEELTNSSAKQTYHSDGNAAIKSEWGEQ